MTSNQGHKARENNLSYDQRNARGSPRGSQGSYYESVSKTQVVFTPERDRHGGIDSDFSSTRKSIANSYHK